TSATDCGPACLKSLLEGHGIAASYGRLREACRTDVDGSSIDTLEQIAVGLGLAAQQVMVPVEHLVMREGGLCPALVVVRQPNGMTHFVVAWRLHRGLVQIMDPATGRRWTKHSSFLEELYVHEMNVAVAAWCEWASSEDFLGPLRHRLRRLGVRRSVVEPALDECKSADGWRPAAALDAAARLCASIVDEGGLRMGREAERALMALFERAKDASIAPSAAIPAEYWTALAEQPEPTTVRLRGAVLLSIAGRAKNAEAAASAAAAASVTDSATAPSSPLTPLPLTPLPPVLARVLSEPRARPGHELVKLLTADGWLSPWVLVVLLALAANGVLVEALLFRALFGIGSELAVPEQRLAGVAALLAFTGLLLALELPISSRTLALGRRLECRARLLLLDRLAFVHDRYFKSRLVSDMAERGHRLHELRTTAELGAEFLRAAFGMVFTAAGIVWLAPGAAVPVLLGVAFCILAPLFAQPLLAESDLRLRNHAGGIVRFHLDALLGIVPLRAHAAGRTMRSQHAALLGQWANAGKRLQRRVVGVEAVQSVAAFALAVVVLFGNNVQQPAAASSLLLVYWVLSLPVMGQQIGLCARRYPALRSITLRFLELIGAPAAEASDAAADAADGADAFDAARSKEGIPAGHGSTDARGVTIRLEHVEVKAAGHTLLADIDLEIEAGRHVAIVGPSGAGKSSLLGLLLGVHEPTAGQASIDGRPLEGRVLAQLRGATAWVDPGVQLWNRSLLDNLCYGIDRAPAVGEAIDRSGIAALLDGLPDGLQTALGEGGTLVSGGEGQRVRLARVALRLDTSLALLDEPFRGLSREVRTDLLAYARELWRESTLLCVTHDIGATLAFDRVLVIEGGRIVEDGQPRVLAERRSRYADLIAAERDAHAPWSKRTWRRLRLVRGRLAEATPESAA
ncbi:MAG: ATP-binding cassette domain-containing protein, partial [Planctomycetota bacterium]